MVCRQRFKLESFPFDTQDLSLEIRLNNPRSWDRFDMLVSNVQLHREAMILTEWTMLCPKVQRDKPLGKVSKVMLRVQRRSRFYVVNVVSIM